MKILTKEQRDFINECTYGNYDLNANTGLVDITGNFCCSRRGLSDFLGIEFGTVKGYFHCYNNKLVSLEGSPQKVGGYFDCSNNQLVSLEGAPIEVMRNFHCYNNKLVSLEGSPQKVGGTFSCANNQLVSLEGAPIEVMGDFDCSNNKLISLAGFFIKVKNTIYCEHNSLDSLAGVKFDIGSLIYCDPISLRGCPPDLLRKIHFYTTNISDNVGPIRLINDIEGIINDLDPYRYLSKMI